jgi:hypothetical protein
MAGAGPPSRGGAACDHCPDEPCLCASIYDRRTAFIRVRWPRPCALNHSSTSVSTLKCTEALFGGMMTFAVRQKSSSTWRLGASARVVVRPAARFSRSSSSEYRLISSLAIFIDFPRADYAPDITTPCERDEEVVVVDASQGAIPPLAVFDAEILCFEDRTPPRGRGGFGASFAHPIQRRLSCVHGWVHNVKPTRARAPGESYAVRSLSTPSAACAAASRATGTRYGLHET